MSVIESTFEARRSSLRKVLMESAKLWAQRSTCSRSQVGVVIASLDNRILVTGYNGAPGGMKHCNHGCTCELSAPYPRVKNHSPSCPSVLPCEIAVHGEANAIAFAAKNGIRLASSRLYTTLSPCYKCAQLIINSGVEEVVYLQLYRDPVGLDLLDDAGIQVVQYKHG